MIAEHHLEGLPMFKAFFVNSSEKHIWKPRVKGAHGISISTNACAKRSAMKANKS